MASDNSDPPFAVDRPTEVSPGELPDSLPGNELKAGARLGNFLIQRQLGEGGMGVVYLAEQLQPVARTVALKLIRQQLRSGLTEAYFEVERQVLARMNHPAIATVFEAGTTEQGFPWFAMQWIDGVALDVWHAREPANLRARLRMVIAISRGVQHAHQRGIIHRDLKPSNVLVEIVDGRAQPKIIDFGIALGVDAKAASVVAGTGIYMSPEQARAALSGIDVRSDVYALGVTLLSLLVPPDEFSELLDRLSVHGRSLQSGVLRSLVRARVERRKPIEPLARIPAELRFVLARALAPDREQRYQSAQALADDLDRYLAARPLEAVPPTRRYRLSRFIRRHRLPLAAGLAVFLALLGGLGAALLALQRAEAEAQKSGTLAEFLSEVISGVDPDKAQGMDKALMRLVLDSAAARAQAKLARQPVTLSAVESVIGKSYDGLGEGQKAIGFHRSAYERMRQRFGPRRRETLELGRVYARTLTNASQLAPALTLIEGLRGDARAAFGPDDAESLRIEATYGWVLRELGRLKEAQVVLEATRARQIELFGNYDDDALDTSYGLAIVLSDLGQPEAAEPIYERLIAGHRKRDGAEHPKVLGLTNSLGSLYNDQRRFGEAEKLFRELLPLYQRVLGDRHAETLGVLGNHATALSGLGRHQEAGVEIQQVVDGFEGTVGSDHPWTLYAWAQLGTHRLAIGDAPGALAAHAHARERALVVVGPKHPLTFSIMAGWAAAAAALGRLDEAERELDTALAGATKVLPAGHPALVELEDKLAALRKARAVEAQP